MWTSILILGPCAFFAGMGASRWAEKGQKKTTENASRSNANNNNVQTVGTSSRVFLQSQQILRSTDPGICLTPPSEESSTIVICLKLQTTGNLLLFKQNMQASSVLWSSQVSLTPGDYWVRLQGDGNLVTTRGTLEDKESAVWDSKSVSTEAEYRLAWDTLTQGIQIERDDEIEKKVVIWSTASTWNGGNGFDARPDDGIVWQPAPIPAPSTMPIPNQPAAPIPAPPTGTIPASPSGPVPTPPTVPMVPSPTATIVDPPPMPTGPVEEEPGTTPKPWFSAPWSTTFSMRSGPMVGHVTDTTARLWALQGQGQVMELAYRVAGASMGYSMRMRPNADQGASILMVDNLRPDTEYEYEVRIQGEGIGNGVWKTASRQMQPTQFKFLLASCMDIKRNRFSRQPVWNEVLSQGEPDFAILNGDTVYLNGGDWTAEEEIILERVWYRNLAQRDETYFRNFISKVPIYSTWDDHEYGTNNSDKNQRGKYNSLRAFRNLWANPAAGTDSLEGVFYSFYRGNVHFIVCDNRWYRDRSTGTQWGAAQIDWVADQLKESEGVFKIIVSGGDVMERGMSQDMDVLGRVITEFGISGVLFCAGDIHRNEFKALDNQYWPYKVTQITSSAIAREWRRPWAIVHVDTSSSIPSVRAHFYGAESESESTTWSNDPNSPCSSIQGVDRNAEHRCTEIISLSDLTP